MIEWGYFLAGAFGAVVGAMVNHLMTRRWKLIWSEQTTGLMNALIAENDVIVRGLCERLRDAEHDLADTRAERDAAMAEIARDDGDDWKHQRVPLTDIQKSILKGEFGVKSTPFHPKPGEQQARGIGGASASPHPDGIVHAGGGGWGGSLVRHPGGEAKPLRACQWHDRVCTYTPQCGSECKDDPEHLT